MSLTDFSFHLFYNPAVFSLTSRNIVLGAIACLLSTISIAQTAAPAPENTPKSSDPELVTCGEKAPLASRTARSGTLVAPDQKHRAYAEI